MRACVLAVLLLAGCAGVPGYPTDKAGNVTLRTDLDSEVRAALDVYRVDEYCAARRQGRVALQGPATSIALAAERPVYLVAIFDTSSFLRGSASTSVGTLLRPRAGRAYEVALRYHAGIYDLAIRETDRAGGASRAVGRRDLAACRLQ
jgi:hypothetical protein